MSAKESILIVDDDQGTRKTLSLIFGRIGYETSTAATGHEALNMVSQRFFNAVLLDIKLPDMEGLELLTPLRNLQPDTVVIVATAYATLETAVQAMNEGAAAYITKPLNMDEALATLRHTLERQRLQLENKRLLEAVQQELGERQRTEAELRRYTDQLTTLMEAERRQHERESALLALARVAGSTLDLNEVMQTILDHLGQLVPFDSATIQLLEGDILHGAAAVGFNFQSQTQSLTYTLSEFPLNRQLIEEQQPICIEDVQTDSRFTIVPGSEPVRSFLGVPLQVKGEPVGIITLDSHRPARFNRRDIELAVAVAAHAAVAIENARLFQQVRQGREQLRDLARYLQSVREEERTRIAREIHDEFGQMLTALKMDLAWLSKRLPAAELVLADKAKDMSTLIDTSIHLVWRVATELRPGLLDDLGLSAAVEWQTQEFADRTGIDYELQLDEELLDLDHDLATTIFRIFQETLTNIVRHANAGKVLIKLEQQPHKLVLTVHDNGQGITTSQISNSGSLGLIGIRERARAWAGEVTFEGQPGQGTTVTVCIPWENGEEARP